MRVLIPLLLVFGLAAVAVAGEAVNAPLPQPLTLESALTVADAEHPEQMAARARVEAAEAGIAVAEAPGGWRAGSDARLAVVGPPAEFYDSDTREDHYARVYLSRTVIDFGRTEAARGQARARFEAAEHRFQTARQSRRLQIMRHYFDVVLADMNFNHATEHMAIVYVGLSRLRDRHELGQVSDVELAEREAEYQRALSQRTRAVQEQRASRNRLAAVLNQPGSPPNRVRPPPLPVLERELPDLDALRTAVRDHNPELLALRQEVAARQAAVRQAEKLIAPSLDFEVAGYAWSESQRSRNDWEAALRLDVPFHQGGARSARRGQARAELREVQARLRQTEMELDQAVLEAWLELHNLRGDRAAADAERDYRELYLSYSRALYQMEVTADLGDSMVRLTDAQRRQAETAFNIAMAWGRIDALRGGMPSPGREGDWP